VYFLFVQICVVSGQGDFSMSHLSGRESRRRYAMDGQRNPTPPLTITDMHLYDQEKQDRYL
jgi:hypothetical protein